MKRIIKLLVVFVGCSTTVMAQSKKEINQQLKNELSEAVELYNAMKDDYTLSYGALERQRVQVRSRVIREIQEEISKNQLIRIKVKNLYSKLEALGEEPSKLVDKEQFNTPIPGLDKVLTNTSDALSGRITFRMVRDTLQWNDMRIKQQNEMMPLLLADYAKAKEINDVSLQRVIQYNQRLEGLNYSIDSVGNELKKQYDQFTVTEKILMAKYEELRANFEKNGPNGFSKAYIAEFGKDPLQKERQKRSKESEFVMGSEPEVLPPPAKEEEVVIYDAVEEQAEFPGGFAGLRAYLKENLVLPESVSSGKVSGKVHLKFVVSTTGKVSNVKVLKGIPDCLECDVEAIRVVKAMPDWAPAKNNGKKVNSYFNLPITFKAQ